MKSLYPSNTEARKIGIRHRQKKNNLKSKLNQSDYNCKGIMVYHIKLERLLIFYILIR